jgi:hypothetical protein
MYCVHGQLPFAKGVSVKSSARPLLRAVLCETPKQTVNLYVHQDCGRPSTGIPEILEAEISITDIAVACHHKRIHRAASVVQQVHKLLNGIEILAGCTQAKVGESSEWTSIVKSAEENRAKFAKL